MDAKKIAAELLDALDRKVLLPPITDRDSAFDARAAYQVAREILRLRTARGEKPVGRKIGFTNRNIWPEYGVYTPMWAHVYDSTVRFLDGTSATLALGKLAQPRLEPEIVLHFHKAPAASADEAQLLSCIDWIAHGCEIVQSHFADWKFKAADTVAAFGLHGALAVGPRRPVAELGDAVRALRTFTISLAKDSAVQARGGGANVLDSPLLALRHLLGLLEEQPQFEPVAAGELVTTGTLTAALLVHPGDRFTTELSGIDLPGLSLEFR